jgi:hypothetical protein
MIDFHRYFERCNPFLRVLDPTIYTLSYIRATSAFLLAAILQTAAQCLPVSRHSKALVQKLDDRLEWLSTEVHKYSYQVRVNAYI